MAVAWLRILIDNYNQKKKREYLDYQKDIEYLDYQDKEDQLEAEMSKTKSPSKQSSDSHDSNYGLFNINTDSKTWSNIEEGNNWSWNNWSWTDLLEVFILMILLGFQFGYLKKKYNHNRERKLTKANRQLISIVYENSPV